MDPLVGLLASSLSCVLISNLCSLMEAAFYAVPASHVRVKANEGRRVWMLLQRMKDHPDRPISGILITNTLANTAGASLAGFYAAAVFESWGAFVFSGALVLAILWISEIIPKTIGVLHARTFAPVIAWPIQALVMLWLPLIYVVGLSTVLIKRKAQDAPTITELELASLAQQGAHEGELYRHEARLIGHVLRLDTVRARELMTPRTVVEMLSDQLTLVEAAEQVRHWRHSRMPVYRGENSDDVYAVCRRLDIFEALARSDEANRSVADLAQPIGFVPEGASAHRLLERFINSRSHIVAIIDEFGAFLGIVTLEDVIESLLGQEIVDESDVHADMQRFALDQARRRGLPVEDAQTPAKEPAAPGMEAESRTKPDPGAIP